VEAAVAAAAAAAAAVGQQSAAAEAAGGAGESEEAASDVGEGAPVEPAAAESSNQEDTPGAAKESSQAATADSPPTAATKSAPAPRAAPAAAVNLKRAKAQRGVSLPLGGGTVLPPLPDLQDPAVQERALRDCLELARMMYPDLPRTAGDSDFTLRLPSSAADIEQQQQQAEHLSPLLGAMLADPATVLSPTAAASVPAAHRPLLAALRGDAGAFLRAAAAVGAVDRQAAVVAGGGGRQLLQVAARLVAQKEGAGVGAGGVGASAPVRRDGAA